MARRVALLAAGLAAIIGLGWAGSLGSPGAVDHRLLLALNPDRERPLLDALMIAVTDFALPTVSVLIAFAGIGAELRLRGWLSPQQIAVGYSLFGVAIAAFVYARFGAIFAHRGVPIAMTPVIAAGFAALGATLRRCDGAALARVRRIVWLTIVSIALAEVALKAVSELGPRRARPFAAANADWNAALRIVPDEYVRGGGCYPSGHAVAIGALLAPLVWIAHGRALRAGAALVAVLCAVSRVYVAAHFPSDAIAGLAIGVAVAGLVVLVLDRSRRVRHSGTAPST